MRNYALLDQAAGAQTEIANNFLNASRKLRIAELEGNSKEQKVYKEQVEQYNNWVRQANNLVQTYTKENETFQQLTNSPITQQHNNINVWETIEQNPELANKIYNNPSLDDYQELAATLAEEHGENGITLVERTFPEYVWLRRECDEKSAKKANETYNLFNNNIISANGHITEHGKELIGQLRKEANEYKEISGLYNNFASVITGVGYNPLLISAAIFSTISKQKNAREAEAKEIQKKELEDKVEDLTKDLQEVDQPWFMSKAAKALGMTAICVGAFAGASAILGSSGGDKGNSKYQPEKAFGDNIENIGTRGDELPEITRLTNDEDYESDIRWNSKGNKIAYNYGDIIESKYANIITHKGLRIKNIENNNLIDLEGEDPDFNPDGDKIVFEEGNDLFIIPVSGGEPEEIQNIGYNYNPVWSPKGDKIAALHYNDSTERYSDISTFNTDGSDLKTIVSADENWLSLYNIKWNPSGDKILFIHMDDESSMYNRHLCVVNSDGSNLIEIKPNEISGIFMEAEWARNGGEIFFNGFGKDGNTVDLYSTNPKGSNLQQITDTPEIEVQPEVAHDGRIIFTIWNTSDIGLGSSEEIYSILPSGYGLMKHTSDVKSIASLRANPINDKILFYWDKSDGNPENDLYLTSISKGIVLGPAPPKSSTTWELSDIIVTENTHLESSDTSFWKSFFGTEGAYYKYIDSDVIVKVQKNKQDIESIIAEILVEGPKTNTRTKLMGIGETKEIPLNYVNEGEYKERIDASTTSTFFSGIIESALKGGSLASQAGSMMGTYADIKVTRIKINNNQWIDISDVVLTRANSVQDLDYSGMSEYYKTFEAGLSSQYKARAQNDVADLLIKDDKGRLVGSDNGIVKNEIPNSYYTGPNNPKFDGLEYILILNPDFKQANAQVYGKDSGRYSLMAKFTKQSEPTSVERIDNEKLFKNYHNNITVENLDTDKEENPSDFNWNDLVLPISTGVAIVVIGGVAYLVHRRQPKKKDDEEEEEE